MTARDGHKGAKSGAPNAANAYHSKWSRKAANFGA